VEHHSAVRVAERDPLLQHHAERPSGLLRAAMPPNTLEVMRHSAGAFCTTGRTGSEC
jgi:hypothetical protein